MNLKRLNGNGPVKVSMIADWIFRILSLTLLIAIPVMVNLGHRLTIVESTRFTSGQGSALKIKVVRLEEKCKGYEKELANLQEQIDRLEGH